MFSNSFLWTVIAFIVGWLCYLSFTKVKDYHNDSTFGAQRGCQLPPELTKKWPLGIDRIKDLWETNAEGRLLQYLCNVAEEYEPRNNLTQYFLFGPRAFHLLHPANVETVLSTQFTDYGFGARPEIFAPLLGNGIFTQEGASWKHSRDLLRKQFIRIKSQNFEHFHENVDNLIDRLPSNGMVDMQPLFLDLTLDIATGLLFGRSVYALRAGIDQDKENKSFSESFKIAQEGLAKRFRIAPWHFFYNPPAFRKACGNVHRFVERYIKSFNSEEAKINEKNNCGFIKQVAEEFRDTTELRDQLLNVLLAGRDTTACCLSWTLFVSLRIWFWLFDYADFLWRILSRLLVRHPNVMGRLRREITTIMEASPTPSRDQIRKIPYLACVIKESLRLYPPVPLNNREAIRTTILPTGGGPEGDKPIMVRKGELVVFSQYVKSRKKNIYGDDAYEFRPERWETGELSHIGWAFFPFSGGPRQCLGEDFAQMEVSYTIVKMLQTFSQILLPRGEPNEPVGSERQRLTLVLLSADGCRVGLRKK